MPHIILMGTLDTKLSEILYLRSHLVEASFSTRIPLQITLIDCGRTPVQHEAISITQTELARQYGSNPSEDFLSLQRGEIIKYMIKCAISCVRDLVQKGDVHGILSSGGSGGTSLASAVMREAVPIGLPKLIVSTVASGDTSAIVGESDITLMYSVVDIAGMNELLKNVLSNAAGAMMGMALMYERTLMSQKIEDNRVLKPKLQLGITMFGVTTPCVDQIREYLTTNYPVEVYVFHATGHGGKAMERLVEEARLDAVLDITTTEICDFLVGGNMSAGPARLEAALKRGIPNIISLGATDMVNFGAKDTILPKFQGRKLLEHNPTVTLMRTTKDECEMVGKFIVDKIKTFAKAPEKVEVWLPRGGVSMIAIPGEIFEDNQADAALAETVKEGLEGTGVRVVEDDRDINSAGFAIDIAKGLMSLI